MFNLKKAGKEMKKEYTTEEKIDLINKGILLSYFRSDEDPNIRCEVAFQGRGKDLTILVHDKEPSVRIAVMSHQRPEDLFILKQDKEEIIRNLAAEFDKEREKRMLEEEDVY